MLIHSTLLRHVQNKDPVEQYQYLRKVIYADRHALQDQTVIGPIRFGLMPSDVRNLVEWINTKIVLNLDNYLYYAGNKTLGVLLRIATGMINKLDLPEEIKQEIHSNVIYNVHKEQCRLELSLLPFQDIEK